MNSVWISSSCLPLRVILAGVGRTSLDRNKEPRNEQDFDKACAKKVGAGRNCLYTLDLRHRRAGRWNAHCALMPLDPTTSLYHGH